MKNKDAKEVAQHYLEQDSDKWVKNSNLDIVEFLQTKRIYKWFGDQKIIDTRLHMGWMREETSEGVNVVTGFFSSLKKVISSTKMMYLLISNRPFVIIPLTNHILVHYFK